MFAKTAFVVETGWDGVSIQEIVNKLGNWAGSTGEVFLDGVEVRPRTSSAARARGSRSPIDH